MNIAICLGSNLLEQALCGQLSAEPHYFNVVILGNESPESPPEPDFIITDVYAIKQKRTTLASGAKTILLDYGLSEDTIASLFITSKISGIMTTDADIRLLLKAFQAINNGQIWIDNCKIKALVNFADTVKDTTATGGLSNKERTIVMSIAQGLTNKEIASQLFISEQTVKTHVNSIFKKLNVTRRTQLVPLGMKLNAFEAEQ